MARKRSTTTSRSTSRRSSAGSPAGASPRSTSSRRSGREAAAPAESDESALGIEGALGIATTVVLLLGLLMLDYTCLLYTSPSPRDS